MTTAIPAHEGIDRLIAAVAGQRRAPSSGNTPLICRSWFWSNQYGLKLQAVGMSVGYDAQVLRGDPAGGSFTLVYLRDGQVVSLDCVNSVRDYVQGRCLVV